MMNYIPTESRVFDEQNLPCMDAETENLITAKREVSKNYLKSNQNRYYSYKYKVRQGKLENVVESSKQSSYKRAS